MFHATVLFTPIKAFNAPYLEATLLRITTKPLLWPRSCPLAAFVSFTLRKASESMAVFCASVMVSAWAGVSSKVALTPFMLCSLF